MAKQEILDDDRKVIDQLKNMDLKTMRVVGRGTLVMSVREAKQSPKYQSLLKSSDKLIRN